MTTEVASEDNLRKREEFAVSLRREKKAKLMAQKRHRLIQRLRKSEEADAINGSQVQPNEAYQRCVSSLKQLESIIKVPTTSSEAEFKRSIEDIYLAFSNAESSFSKDNSNKLLEETGSIFNLAKVFSVAASSLA